MSSEFAPEIEELRAKLGVRKDYLKKFLEKSQPSTLEEALKIIEEKYGTNVKKTTDIKNTKEEAGSDNSGASEIGVLGEATEPSEPMDVGSDEESTDNDESKTDSESVSDGDDSEEPGVASEELRGPELGKASIVLDAPKKKLYHPVTGKEI